MLFHNKIYTGLNQKKIGGPKNRVKNKKKLKIYIPSLKYYFQKHNWTKKNIKSNFLKNLP